jgi:hypothetical protein
MVRSFLLNSYSSANPKALPRSTGTWMRWENRKRNQAQGITLTARDIPTETLGEGPSNPEFRYMY